MFNFKVVTPEKTYLEGEASMVVLPGIALLRRSQVA